MRVWTTVKQLYSNPVWSTKPLSTLPNKTLTHIPESFSTNNRPFYPASLPKTPSTYPPHTSLKTI